jgi:hypothetical protein
MNRLEKIEQEAQKARERIAAMQALLKDIEGKRTEQENLQIVQQIRALKLTREELYAFLGGAGLPALFAGATADDYAPEPKHSRRKGRHDGEPAADTETPEIESNPYTETTNYESEGVNHEEQ